MEWVTGGDVDGVGCVRPGMRLVWDLGLEATGCGKSWRALVKAEAVS